MLSRTPLMSGDGARDRQAPESRAVNLEVVGASLIVTSRDGCPGWATNALTASCIACSS